jgi:hypothetical protein
MSVTFQHISALSNILTQTQTHAITHWDESTYARAIGWGLFFEMIVLKRRADDCVENQEDEEDMNAKDQAWITSLLNDKTGGEKCSELAAWGHVTPSELRDARNLIDRYILHSPFIDLNQRLLRLVLQRKDTKAATFVQERFVVDTSLQVAHTIHKLLKKSVEAASTP